MKKEIIQEMIIIKDDRPEMYLFPAILIEDIIHSKGRRLGLKSMLNIEYSVCHYEIIGVDKG
jgi:hypothetical protein